MTPNDRPDTAAKALKVKRAMGLCFFAFVLNVSYSLARPAVESLFLQAHKAVRLPVVWLAVALAMLLAVALYNRWVKGRNLILVYGGAAALSASLLALLLLARRLEVPFVHYALYVWKDVYMVVLIEIFYTYANTVFPIQTARWVYGLFGACGAVGGILGNLAVGAVADWAGSVAPLFGVFGLLGLSFLGALVFARIAGQADHDPGAGRPSLREALALVRKSRYLLLILGLVALVQVAVTLVDYQFNVVIERAYPNVDVRTGVIGQVYAAINFSTVVLNGLVGPVLRLIGVPAALLFVPLFLGTALTVFVAVPRFATAAILKVASKCLDYSLFRGAKEILYIPLGYREKVQGKSISDMLVYRLAKGGASVLLLGVGWIAVGWLVLPLTFAAVLGWLAVTVPMIRRFRAKVSRAQELHAGRTR